MTLKRYWPKAPPLLKNEPTPKSKGSKGYHSASPLSSNSLAMGGLGKLLDKNGWEESTSISFHAPPPPGPLIARNVLLFDGLRADDLFCGTCQVLRFFSFNDRNKFPYSTL
ncbi:hypothetical protein NPIL_245671 [Nephila pilipes]|uniref:Uncharacterized protein n=1 Tax=Nephila pilipes TaxID=299642 RepID=A0A8X6NVI8_NEPPI|nr:hypothetical protein NPIL_245671 [Nephila pilipes]